MGPSIDVMPCVDAGRLLGPKIFATHDESDFRGETAWRRESGHRLRVFTPEKKHGKEKYYIDECDSGMRRNGG